MVKLLKWLTWREPQRCNSQWYVHQSLRSSSWQVVDEDYSVVCIAKSKLAADEIVRDHNRDGIRR